MGYKSKRDDLHAMRERTATREGTVTREGTATREGPAAKVQGYRDSQCGVVFQMTREGSHIHEGPATWCRITDPSDASHTRGKVWQRGGNAASRDGCRVKEAAREGSDDSDRKADQKGKRREGEARV